MKYNINQNQCGFLMKHGSFVKTLYQGNYYYSKMLGYEVIIEEMKGSVQFAKVAHEVLLQDEQLKAHVLEIQVPEGHLGILKENGVVKQALDGGRYLLWNAWGRYDCQLLDMRQPELCSQVGKDLPPGTYHFWNVISTSG